MWLTGWFNRALEASDSKSEDLVGDQSLANPSHNLIYSCNANVRGVKQATGCKVNQYIGELGDKPSA